MCVVCASLRPWTPDCDYAELDLRADAPDASGPGTDGTGRPLLTPEEAAHRILTDGWGWAYDAPYLRFDARAGDALTVDLAELGDRALVLARAALAEWSAVTGLAFRETAPAALPEGAEGEDVAATKEGAALIEPVAVHTAGPDQALEEHPRVVLGGHLATSAGAARSPARSARATTTGSASRPPRAGSRPCASRAWARVRSPIRSSCCATASATWSTPPATPWSSPATARWSSRCRPPPRLARRGPKRERLDG